MEQINNDQTIKECSAVLGHQVENIPQLDTSKIILVSNVNPKDYRRNNIVRTVTKTNSGTSTIYTTPQDKDFYLTGVTFSIIKDATCDMSSTAAGIQAYILGINTNLSPISTLTLTAQNNQIFIDFNNPILIDKNTTITIAGNTFTTGSCIRSSTIYGYTLD